MMLKEAGYPVKVITGYEGTSEQNLAILRGEAEGNIDVYTDATDAIEDEGFKVITKLGDHPDFANVKSFRQAVDGKSQQVAEVLDGLLRLGRPFLQLRGFLQSNWRHYVKRSATSLKTRRRRMRLSVRGAPGVDTQDLKR
jgi:hypothetical protein